MEMTVVTCYRRRCVSYRYSLLGDGGRGHHISIESMAGDLLLLSRLFLITPARGCRAARHCCFRRFCWRARAHCLLHCHRWLLFPPPPSLCGGGGSLPRTVPRQRRRTRSAYRYDRSWPRYSMLLPFEQAHVFSSAQAPRGAVSPSRRAVSAGAVAFVASAVWATPLQLERGAFRHHGAQHSPACAGCGAFRRGAHSPLCFGGCNVSLIRYKHHTAYRCILCRRTVSGISHLRFSPLRRALRHSPSHTARRRRRHETVATTCRRASKRRRQR